MVAEQVIRVGFGGYWCQGVWKWVGDNGLMDGVGDLRIVSLDDNTLCDGELKPHDSEQHLSSTMLL